ncbi:MAG: gamma-carotene 1'-hydroxylase CruF [Cyanobacteria bacterium P01_G01_bin.54]
MKQLATIERALLIGHIISMAFGLAGLLIVLPNAEIITSLSAVGQQAFQWSMAGGGVIYMILGTATVALYAYRSLGFGTWLSFMLPAVGLSLLSELLGTSTGFPFGHYRYLSGLGYKIADLVPFTIPLSWFYLGCCAYLLARVGLESRAGLPRWSQLFGAVTLGSLLLTAWDFVLDPAMSQADVPFWLWEQPGPFFGMPYQNFLGWLGTGIVFMTVATLLWPKQPLTLSRQQLRVPLIVYLSNFVFSMVMSLGSGFFIPVVLGLGIGAGPAIAFYFLIPSSAQQVADTLEKTLQDSEPIAPNSSAAIANVVE